MGHQFLLFLAMHTSHAYNMSNVIIPNPEKFQEKKRLLLQGGLAALQVISDFDKTLTPAHANGKPAASTYGILEQSGLMSPGFHQRAKELYDKYSKIETSLTMPLEEKTKHMVDWWNLANQNLIDEHAPFSVIERGVKKCNTALRQCAQALFSQLRTHGVPLLIFSAGIGDVLIEILKHHGVSITENMHVISNFVEVNEAGIISAFKGRMIHVFNKNEVLNIGYLNDDTHDPQRLALYKDSWDVVITNDGGLDFVNSLLDEIKAQTRDNK